MYEDRTDENIKKEMLDKIETGAWKSEGSFFYDVLSPVAIELALSYINLDTATSKLDAENLQGEELFKFVEQRTGITRKPAIKATTEVIISGQEGSKISIGDLAGAETINFVVTEDKTIDDTGQTTVTVECEQAGSIGNVPAGAIKYFPIQIPGLTSVTNPEPVTNGYDSESDESLLAKYYDRLQTPATSGNKYHYINWAKEVVGVGDAKVIPLWNGAGTVKVIIVDSNKQPAIQGLQEEVYNHIEEVRPIGANITVVSATPKTINISATVVLASGYALFTVQQSFERAIEEYRKDIAFKETYISHAKVGNILLSTPGVIDYTGLKLNDTVANIPLADEEIPVFNSIDLEV